MPVTNRFTHACSSQSPSALSRRGFLQVGAIPGLGIGLADLLRGQASAAGSAHAPKAKSVILVWLQGGVSHHDTFDMKPDAATEIRGPFQPIATRLPGVHVCEHLPEMARRMDHLTVLRSLTHGEPAHHRGTRQMLTFRQPVTAGLKPTDHPDLACCHYLTGLRPLPGCSCMKRAGQRKHKVS